MRNITTNIELEIEGEKKSFAIRKMNAFDGSYLLKVVTEKVLPLLQKAMNAANAENEEEITLMQIAGMLPDVLASLDADEMKRIMVMCLKTVSILLPAGYQPVVDSRGNFGDEELEYDVASCLRLTYEVIMYNCGGFFGGSGLSSLLTSQNGSQLTP